MNVDVNQIKTNYKEILIIIFVLIISIKIETKYYIIL